MFPLLPLTHHFPPKVERSHKNWRLIRTGTFAEVYEIADSHVMKVPIIDPKDGPYGVPGIIELDILTRLTHPNLSKAVESSIQPTGITHIMPNYGQNISNFEHKEKLPWILYQIASACHFLHSNGLLHMDIYPDNILVDTNHKATLIDFGQCLFTDDVTVGFTTDGTYLPLRYRDPEQLLGYTYADQALDVWGLGITILCAYRGQAPGPEEVDQINLIQWHRQFLCQEETRRNFIMESLGGDFALVDLLVKMLAPIGTDRPSMKDILGDPYYTMLDYKPINGISVYPSVYSHDVTEIKTVPIILEIAKRGFQKAPAMVIFLSIDLAYRTQTLQRFGIHAHAITCFYIASKYRDSTSARRYKRSFKYYTDKLNQMHHHVSPSEMASMEIQILQSIDGIVYRNPLWDACSTKEQLIHALSWITDYQAYINIKPSERAEHSKIYHLSFQDLLPKEKTCRICGF